MAGVAIDSILDMRILFDGIPLDKMTVSMTMNGAVLPVLALYIVAAEEQGVAHEQLAGTIQNDILKEFMVRNTYIYPPAPSMRIIADIFAFTSQKMPKFNSISISGYHMQEAGATADLELGYTLADGLEYVRAGIAAGIDIDAFAPRLSFFWAIGMNFFMEVAKMRAARLLWAKLVKEQGAKTEKSLSLRTHCQTSGWSLTAQDVFNNVVRTCIEAMAATQGHTQSLHTNSLDEALALPTDFSARIARNTQLFIQQESGTTRVIDPWGGSYYVERLTHELAAQAWAHIDEVEGLGGMAKAIEAGHPQAAHRGGGGAHAGAHRLGPAVDHRREQVPTRRRRADRRAQGRQRRRARRQIAKLERLRAERDAGDVDAALDALTDASAETGEGNLLELAVDAARARATVGEISAALEKVWGRHQAEIRSISGVYRREVGDSNDTVIEVRRRVEAFERAEGRRPRILVAKMGQDGHDRGQKVIATASPTSASTSTSGRCSRRPRRRRARRSRTTCTSSARRSLAAGHLTLVPELVHELAELGRQRHPRRRRRRHPAPGLRRAARRRRRGDLPAGHRDRRGRPGDARHPRRAPRLLSRCPDLVTGCARGGDRAALGQAITLIESRAPTTSSSRGRCSRRCCPRPGGAHRVGITGVPGVGKCTFIDEFGIDLCEAGHQVAVLAIDPTSQRTGGAILGDKTRMARLVERAERVHPAVARGRDARRRRAATRETMLLCEAAGFDVVLVETVGVGQCETTVADMVDFFLVLMLAGAGDELQGIKKGVLELADVIAVNKADGDNVDEGERGRRRLPDGAAPDGSRRARTGRRRC